MFSAQRGQIAFTVPHFGRYLLATAPELRPHERGRGGAARRRGVTRGRPSTDSWYSPAVLSDPRPGSAAGLSFVRPGGRWALMAAPPGRSIERVPDPKLEIQMLHDRVMIRVTDGDGERRSSAGIVIPATAEVAKRLIWGEVFGVGQHVRTVKVGDRVLFGGTTSTRSRCRAAPTW